MDSSRHTLDYFLNHEDFVKSMIYATENQDEVWALWQKQYPQDVQTMEQARKILLSLQVKEPVVTAEKIQSNLARLKSDYGITEESNGRTEAKEIPLNRTKWWNWSVAALLALAIGAGWWTYEKQSQQEGSFAAEKIVKTNPKGQKMIVTLEDGSSVKMNGESRLTYSSNFRENRTVTLEGEAFFEVKRDTLHPFTVKTKQLETRVLGTSFNVRSYGDESSSSVVVATGKVAVKRIGKADKITLLPNQMAKYSPSSGLTKNDEVNMELHLGWKNNVLMLENADFDKIEKELTRWFNVEFEYNQKPKIKSFNGRFENQSLENILLGVAFSTGLKYKLDRQKVIILENP